jgi:hypothetical protein
MESVFSKWSGSSQGIYATGYLYRYRRVICFNLLSSNECMLEDFEEQQRKRTTRIRSFMDFTMGGLLVIAGTLLLIYKVGNLDDINRKGLGILFVLYGIWRLYRGYKKNYFR